PLERGRNLDRLHLALEHPCERRADDAFEAPLEALRKAHCGASVLLSRGRPARFSWHARAAASMRRVRPMVLARACERAGAGEGGRAGGQSMLTLRTAAAGSRVAAGKWRNGRRARFRSVCP